MKIIEKIMEKQLRPTEAAPVTFAFLGDSVTQGCFELYKTGKCSFETEFRVNEGYPAKLRQLLELCYPRVPINMIHAGISGDTVVSGLKRAQRDVIAYHPDLTVVCYGLNDCCKGTESLNTYKTALEWLLKTLNESGTELIFLTPNLIAHRLSPEVSDEYMCEAYRETAAHYSDLLCYMDAARTICQKLKVPVCDCTRKWEILKKNGVDVIRLLSNRINHPTQELYWMFAVSLFEMIQGM